MSHGGARKGAGRKVGALTQKTREIAERASETGITPLDYLLSVLRDPANETSVRIDVAKAAAPYMHPRLSNVEAKISGDSDNPLIMRIELIPGSA